VLDGSFSDVKRHLVIWQFLVISIRRLSFLAPNLDNTQPLLALVITPGFYLHLVEVAEQDTASGSL